MKTIVTLVTAPGPKEARRLAQALVVERLAACVTVIPGAASTYRWKGKVHVDREHVLIIKSRRSLARRLERRIRELHPYEVPEILHLDVASGSTPYLKWLAECTKP